MLLKTDSVFLFFSNILNALGVVTDDVIFKGGKLPSRALLLLVDDFFFSKIFELDLEAANKSAKLLIIDNLFFVLQNFRAGP